MRIKASYTVEAAIYLPIILFVILQTLELSIAYWQKSKDREICEELQQLDIISDFYGYQIMDEVREEIVDD